jgi:putative colanic acid biosynthesis glycosyltransferase
MSMAPPFISVIVVCKNPGTRLADALDSVWAQQEVAVELVVVDGASSDGTAAWLAARRDRIATLISEPDGSVYEAKNKGLAAAQGEWVLFLGADDRLVGQGVLYEASKWLARTSSGVAAGEVAYDDGRIYKLARRINPLARNFVRHPAAFYRRSLFAEHDGFDPSLTFAGDYDFNLRLWKAHVRFKPFPLRIAACRPGGLSDAGHRRAYREEIAVRHRYYPAWRCWFWDALTLLRALRPSHTHPRSSHRT